MLGRLKKQDGLGSISLDPGTNRHADAHVLGLHADNIAHQTDAFGQVNKDNRVRVDRWTRMDDGHGMNCAMTAGGYPFPVEITCTRLGDARWKETAAAGARTLEAELAAPKRISPLLFRPHHADLWGGR